LLLLIFLDDLRCFNSAYFVKLGERVQYEGSQLLFNVGECGFKEYGLVLEIIFIVPGVVLLDYTDCVLR
jgi:hypothetical protein